MLPRSEQDTGMGCPDSLSFGLLYERLETEAELDTCHARMIPFCIAVIIVIAVVIVIAFMLSRRCHRSHREPTQTKPEPTQNRTGNIPTLRKVIGVHSLSDLGFSHLC